MGVKVVLIKQPLDDAMIALVLLTRSQLRVDPSSPARAPLPSEASDPIVAIDTSKMTLALEEGSKKTISASPRASKVLPSVAVSRVSTTAASVTPSWTTKCDSASVTASY